MRVRDVRAADVWKAEGVVTGGTSYVTGSVLRLQQAKGSGGEEMLTSRWRRTLFDLPGRTCSYELGRHIVSGDDEFAFRGILKGIR